MTEEIKDRIIGDIEELNTLIQQYSAVTSEILGTDIDETLEDIIRRRGDIIDRIGAVRADIDDVRSGLSEQESELIRKMIVGGHVPLGISAEMRAIHKSAVKMHSAFLSVADKDKAASARVDARIKELRTELENINSGRRTVAGYNPAGFGSAGSSFDGRL